MPAGPRPALVTPRCAGPKSCEHRPRAAGATCSRPTCFALIPASPPASATGSCPKPSSRNAWALACSLLVDASRPGHGNTSRRRSRQLDMSSTPGRIGVRVSEANSRRRPLEPRRPPRPRGGGRRGRRRRRRTRCSTRRSRAPDAFAKRYPRARRLDGRTGRGDGRAARDRRPRGRAGSYAQSISPRHRGPPAGAGSCARPRSASTALSDRADLLSSSGPALADERVDEPARPRGLDSAATTCDPRAATGPPAERAPRERILQREVDLEPQARGRGCSTR